jgi:Zn-dependent protease with chaperone function
MEIQTSASFKKMTTKAIFAIVLFMLVYILLLALAIGLTILCGVAGIALIVFKPMVITIGLGLGLASLGFFILIFLFKFLFKKHKIDRSHLVEITQDQEPRLFQFIQEIVQEVGTDFPKKIYLSSDVNASVFYDSSFWSMFFPIRKNLQIGIGLVNTISEQEFKAIMAHEFGHFSQRTMKVGSFVYNVNQVIYNMLYDNESFQEMIERWANISGYFSLFVHIAVGIISGIQSVLKKMYEVVNISYMALSREMEFHADEVAANVAGYLPLKESLLRMDLADHSYSSVVNYYTNRVSDGITTKNIFQNQRFVLKYIAQLNNYSIKNDLPVLSNQDLSKYNKSKLNIKDQWASHPSTIERINALEKLNIVKSYTNSNLAISLFDQVHKWEELFTEKLFSSIVYESNTQEIAPESFQTEFSKLIASNSFPAIYNDYYDNKNPTLFDVDDFAQGNTLSSLEDLFNREKVDMVYELIALENDKNAITSINSGEYNIKTFDYDGKKYKAKDAVSLLILIDKEIELRKEKIKQNDIQIYQFFLSLATKQGKEVILKEKYREYFRLDKAFDKRMDLFAKIYNASDFIRVTTTFDIIELNLKDLAVMEIEFKNDIRSLINQELLKGEIPDAMFQNYTTYLSGELTYFSGNRYKQDNLNILITAMNDYNFIVSRHYFLTKMDLLTYQAELLNN